MGSLYRKLWRRIPFLSLALLSGASAIHAQSALDGFDPNANGSVRVVVVQPDGRILVGGLFTTLSPDGGPTVPRNHLARLNPDGSLDTAFNPNANDTVFAIAVQPDGKILIGGDFTMLAPNGGVAVTRNRIARLNADGSLDTVFDPNANDTVWSIAVQPDGKILVGGAFNGANSIGGQARNRMARLDATTGTADLFDPNASGRIFSIVIQADGKILVGGEITSIGGEKRHGIARLDPASGLADSFDPNASTTVYTIAIQADGKILAGGAFGGANSIGGQARNRIARLDPVTGMADSFDPNANGRILSIALQPDGKILAAGDFDGIGGQTRIHFARLDAITGLADAFDPNVDTRVYAIAVQADGKILVGFSFSGSAGPNNVGGQVRNGIARLETDGRLDRTLNLNLNNITDIVHAIAMQPDGKILIGGYFPSLGGTRKGFARLNTDGSIDTAFNPNPQDGGVLAILLQADGKIMVGGTFTSIGGQMRNCMARLEPTTGQADSFNPNPNSPVGDANGVHAIAVQADGKIFVSGYFNRIGGQMRNYFARLDPITGLADSFDPNANNPYVYPIALQADGRILAGGDFTFIGGQVRRYIARLDPTTGLSDSFNPNSTADVAAIAVQPDGKILAGGYFGIIDGQQRRAIAQLDPATGHVIDAFNAHAAASFVTSIALQTDGKIIVAGDLTAVGGQIRNRIARLDAKTGSPDSFNPDAGGGDAYSLAIQADGKVLVGGLFSSIGGQIRGPFARLTNDTAALQNLAVRQHTVTWTRGGSSPQLARATFEFSTDNVSYNFIGNGTLVGGNWILTGLSLPLGQNIYIRARGYYRSGNLNGSESLTESVRNAFITLPPTPTRVVSRKLHNGAPFDIDLPSSGNAGIECRSGGASNNYQVVFTFPSAVTFNSAAITAAAGSVSSTSGNGTNNPTVNLTGVTSAQKIIVTLLNLRDSTNGGDLEVPMGVVVGDVNGSGSVNASDVILTKSKSGQPIDATNFRNDVTADGSINASDASLVKSSSGTGLP